MRRFRALDLFCGAGGASAGLSRAGFEVTGVDVRPQPNYPYEFLQVNALQLSRRFLKGFDLIWASPPCQFATAYARRPNHVAQSLNRIPEVRDMLLDTGYLGPAFVIENVVGARSELRQPVMLCGSSFGLNVRRHRLFEANGFTIAETRCIHEWQTPRFPPATNRTNLRSTVEIGVWRIPLQTQQDAMGGVNWMTREELSQAIPPAYAYHIARGFLDTK